MKQKYQIDTREIWRRWWSADLRFPRRRHRIRQKKEAAEKFIKCSAVRVLDEKFRNLALPHPEYDENLTLEVLAGEVHMNPYYFSSFFKKNAGENFKDYLSRIRVQHAVSLLVSTDMKAY